MPLLFFLGLPCVLHGNALAGLAAPAFFLNILLLFIFFFSSFVVVCTTYGHSSHAALWVKVLPLCLFMAVVYPPCVLGGWNLHMSSELELCYHFCCDLEPPKLRAPLKQSEGFEARHQYQISWPWLLVPLQLRSPKEMRRDRRHPRVAQSRLLARQRELQRRRLLLALLWHLCFQLRLGWPEAHQCYLLPWVWQLCYVLTFLRHELVKRYQHLRLCHRSPWDFHQV